MLAESASTCRHWAIASPEPFPTLQIVPGLTATTAAYNAAMNACDQGNRWCWSAELLRSMRTGTLLLLSWPSPIVKDSGWLVITQNDYNDIPMFFLVPPKNKRASLGVNVVFFFPLRL